MCRECLATINWGTDGCKEKGGDKGLCNLINQNTGLHSLQTQKWTPQPSLFSHLSLIQISLISVAMPFFTQCSDCYYIWKVFVLSKVWSLYFLLHYICGQPWLYRGFLKCLDPKYRAKQRSTCLNFSVVPARDVTVVWGSQNKGKHLRWSFRE